MRGLKAPLFWCTFHSALEEKYLYCWRHKFQFDSDFFIVSQSRVSQSHQNCGKSKALLTVRLSSECLRNQLWYIEIPACLWFPWAHSLIKLSKIQPRRGFGRGGIREGRRFRAAPFIPPSEFLPILLLFSPFRYDDGSLQWRERERAPFFSAHFTDHSSF